VGPALGGLAISAGLGLTAPLWLGAGLAGLGLLSLLPYLSRHAAPARQAAAPVGSAADPAPRAADPTPAPAPAARAADPAAAQEAGPAAMAHDAVCTASH